MSTQELVYNLPKLNRRYFERKLKFVKLKTQRYIKAKIRKTKSISIAYWRRQYFLTSAQADLKRAVASNEDIFIGSTIIATIIGYCFATNATDFLLLFFQTAYDASTISGANMFLLAIAAIGSITVLLAWIMAFMMNMQSLALMEGVTGKQYRSIRRTVRNGLRLASRVASTWALLLGLMAIPVLLIAASAYTYISVAALPLKDVLALAPQLGAAAALAIVAVLLHYGLAPYVALFETDTPLRKTLKRSRQLVRRKGRIFLFATYTAFAAALAGVYGIALGLEQLINLPIVVTCAIGGLATIMTLNGIMVMLYRKRKLARKN